MKVVVTGGSSGLGREICMLLAAKGHKVLFSYFRNKEGAEELVRQYGCEAFQCNFSENQDVDSFCAKINEWKPDALINNAHAILEVKHFHRFTAEEVDAGFRSNVLPAVKMALACIRLFRKQKQGRIITTLSNNVVNRPGLGVSIYTAEKMYLLGLHRSWVTEFEGLNLQSFCVSPGMMMTNLMKASMDERQLVLLERSQPMGRFILPSEVAPTYVVLLETSTYANGSHIIVDGENYLV